MSLSFGLACGSLVAVWFLGELPQTERAVVTDALHLTVLTVGGMTGLSSLTFWTLRAQEGASVSRERQSMRRE